MRERVPVDALQRHKLLVECSCGGNSFAGMIRETRFLQWWLSCLSLAQTLPQFVQLAFEVFDFRCELADLPSGGFSLHDIDHLQLAHFGLQVGVLHKQLLVSLRRFEVSVVERRGGARRWMAHM